MAFVIYNKETTRTLRMKGKEYYATAAAAKAALTRYSKKSELMPTNPDYPLFLYGIAEVGYFRDHIEKTKVVKNAMSGKKTRIPVNTPMCCDPSSETYWSM